MTPVLFELDHNRTRLEYFTQQRNRALAALQASGSRVKTTSYDKWVEIYSDRIAKLERQATKLGLKTQLAKIQSSELRA
jgi:hypothetical protein